MKAAAEMEPWEQHHAIISMPRFAYNPASVFRQNPTGFLITCTFRREKSATKEAITLLQEYLNIAEGIPEAGGARKGSDEIDKQQQQKEGETLSKKTPSKTSHTGRVWAAISSVDDENFTDLKKSVEMENENGGFTHTFNGEGIGRIAHSGKEAVASCKDSKENKGEPTDSLYPSMDANDLHGELISTADEDVGTESWHSNNLRNRPVGSNANADKGAEAELHPSNANEGVDIQSLHSNSNREYHETSNSTADKAVDTEFLNPNNIRNHYGASNRNPDKGVGTDLDPDHCGVLTSSADEAGTELLLTNATATDHDGDSHDSGIRFVLVNLATMGVVYISASGMSSSTVLDVASRILRDVQAGKRAAPQWCHRMLPVQVTCSTEKDELQSVVSKLVKDHLQDHHLPSDSTISYAVAFNRRGGNSTETSVLGRDECIKIVTAAVEKVSERMKVNLTMPQMVVFVELIPVTGIQNSLTCLLCVLTGDLVVSKPKLNVKPLASQIPKSKKRKQLRQL